MSSLLINGSVPTALQLAAIRSDLGLGTGDPGTPNGVALLDGIGDLPVVQLPNNVSPLGPYTTVALLEAAYSAAANPGKTAYIGAAAPYVEYVSNGSTGVTGWKSVATIITAPDGTVSGIAGAGQVISLDSQSAFRQGKRLKAFLNLATTMRAAIVHCGDSNTAFGGRGWTWYFGYSAQRQFGSFGTGVHPINGALGPYQVFGGGGTRTAAAPAALDKFAPFGLGDGLPGYMYVPAGSSEQIQSYIESTSIGYPHPMNQTGALKVRTSYGTFSTGTGNIQPTLRVDAPPYNTVYQSSVINTNTGAEGIVDFTTTIAADATRAKQLAWTPSYTNGYVVGPAFIQYQSISRSDKLAGLAYQMLYYRGGFSARDMLREMTAWGIEAAKEYLRQTRLILTDSGQTRTPVCILINHGMNDRNIADGDASLGPVPTTPGSSAAAFKDNLTGVMNLFRNAWAALGAPASDLYFMLVPSHPASSPDDSKLISYRDAAAQLADSLSDVSSVDITKITPASDFDALGLWDAGGSAHLKDLGYSTTALTLWSQLARDEPSDSYSAKLPSYQAVVAQADGFYRPDFALGTFTSLGPVTVAMTIQNPNVTPPGGTKVQVKITQDGTGARAITWDTRFVFTTAFINTGNTAGKYTVCEFVSDGTNFLSLQPNVWM